MLPMKNPALVPSGSNCSCACDAYVMDSNCKALSKPSSMFGLLGIANLYVTSADSTEDNDADSTTRSGCCLPIFNFDGQYSAYVSAIPISSSSDSSSSSSAGSFCFLV